jgi:hypothetical protein
MFRMSFVLKKKRDGTLVLVLPVWFRILFLFIIVLLAAGVAVSGMGASGQWIPILIIIVCIVGALYEEKWVFNKLDNNIEYISGLLFYKRRKTFILDEVDAFILTGNLREDDKEFSGRLLKRIVSFSFILKSGKELNIDNSSDRVGCMELRTKADVISTYCEIKLEMNNNIWNTQ